MLCFIYDSLILLLAYINKHFKKFRIQYLHLDNCLKGFSNKLKIGTIRTVALNSVS